jgi:hypothetical protein
MAASGSKWRIAVSMKIRYGRRDRTGKEFPSMQQYRLRETFVLGRPHRQSYRCRCRAGLVTMTEIQQQRGFAGARVKTLLAVMFCDLFYYTGRRNFGFAIPGMSEELGLSKTQLGWCGTALLWSSAIGQAINGQLADRFGGRSLMSFIRKTA